MSTYLVIVESPAKGKTLKKYLGKGFQVLASYGHVRDLIPKKGAVDPDNHFAMKYVPLEKAQKAVEAIASAATKADKLYLATDPDREGEAIAWHLRELLKTKKALKDKPFYRVSFNQITKSAVKNAVEHPRDISLDLVNAQQARRALDYLMGFYVSPLMWKKIRRGLSAGRVQSPALRLIVEREEAIEAFKSQEYWTITADTSKEETDFTARLIEYQEEKLTQFSVTTEAQAQAIEKALHQSAKGLLDVIEVTKKQRKRHPSPPFITSTLQQEAARKLGFSASRTMRIAQQLYEGIDIGEGEVGLISYMRTDSVNLAEEAIESIRNVIESRYGKANLPAKPNTYKTKAKNAQEAHEAIRPTDATNIPEAIKKHLNADQFKLYDLIWKRTIACQMIHALIDTVAVDLSAGKGNRFRANGSTIAKPGFIAVYQEGLDDGKQLDTDSKMLPILKKGDKLPLKAIRPEQHFTEPPPRYSEATLVKALEEHGIGRPSTYASIIATLQNRDYATLDKKRFIPTDVGRVVNRFLTSYFGQYVDYEFTAKMEDSLDAVSRGETEWLRILEDFWPPLKTLIDKIDQEVDRSDITQEAIDENCPECGKPLSKRLGRLGQFIGCTGYPECRYTRNIDGEKSTEPEVLEGRVCPDCSSPLVIKMGRYGRFIGCSNYPECKHIEPLEKPEDTGISCPQCKGKGTLLKRKSRRGTYFYSCSTYPTCKYATWNPPLAEKCPQCGWPILTVKTTKRHGTQRACPQKDCGFLADYDEGSGDA